MLKFFLFFFLLCSTCFAQTVKGIYTSHPLRGVGEDKELSDLGKKPTYFYYIYSNKSSLQRTQTTDEVAIDSTSLEVNGQTFYRTDRVNNPTNLFYYKNYNEDVYRVDYTQNNKDISVRDHIPRYQWNFETGTKQIAGYTCKKATTTATKVGSKQNIVAWYCEDIPINDGMMDFNGLPGLILQVELNDFKRITFEKIVISPKENIDIPEPPKTIEPQTLKEFEIMTSGKR